MRKVDYVGRRYGRLVVTEVLPTSYSHGRWQPTKVRCQCDCGEEIIVYVNNLRTGNTHSCGCLRKELGSVKLEYARMKRKEKLNAAKSKT